MNGIYDSKLLRGGCVGRHIFQLIFEVEHIHGHTLVCQKNDGSIKISFFNFIILKPFFFGGGDSQTLYLVRHGYYFDTTE